MSPCVSFIQTTMTSNIQLVSLSSADFSPQPEEEILQCLKSPHSEPVWLSLRLGAEDRRRHPPVEGTGSAGLSFFKAESRPTSGSTVARPAPWTACWPAFPPRVLCSETPSNAACFSHCTASPSFRGRHLYLRVTIKNNKVLIERQIHVLPERNH